MKNLKKIGMLTLICIATATFNGCKKDGETGPKGETGLTGPAGAANIQNYDFTVYASQWVYDGLYQRWYYKHYTSSINSQSAVLAYVMSGSGKQAIPYSVYSPTNFQIGMAANLFATQPYIEFQYTNISSPTTAPTSDKYIYIVAIPPAMIAANPNVDLRNFEQVKQVFNIK